ncbi:unnamed protein product [Brassicogethes aeneus]|uniref:Uncharacterized protein n=1 Tax=Brassicogethes aeneus TaxID=1431903 RepID=A0A9P0FBQ9_BRAAE|nr:unnamed protein product [Brassicogethes aeneus]
MNIISVVLFVIVVSFGGCLCRPSSEDLKKYRKHSSYVGHFTCGTSLPRLVKSSILLKNMTNVYKIEPEYTVLYQCNCNGICTPGQTCRGIPEDVTLSFRIMLNYNDNKFQYISAPARNETLCYCDTVKENTNDCILNYNL